MKRKTIILLISLAILLIGGGITGWCLYKKHQENVYMEKVKNMTLNSCALELFTDYFSSTLQLQFGLFAKYHQILNPMYKYGLLESYADSSYMNVSNIQSVYTTTYGYYVFDGTIKKIENLKNDITSIYSEIRDNAPKSLTSMRDDACSMYESLCDYYGLLENPGSYFSFNIEISSKKSKLNQKMEVLQTRFSISDEDAENKLRGVIGEDMCIDFKKKMIALINL